MRREVDAPIIDFYGESITVPANSGAPIIVPTRNGFNEVLLYDKQASPVGFKLSLAPSIRGYFYDVSATSYVQIPGTVFDGHVTGSTGTILDSWVLTNDHLYIGSRRPFGGIYIDILAGSPNATTSTLTAKYSKNDGTFASQAITDGSASGGATLAQDGAVKLDAVPSDWAPYQLGTILESDNRDIPSDYLFWLQYTVGATLDADTEISNIYPLAADYASSTGGYFVGAVEYYIDLDGNVGALQLISQDGGTETTTATWIKR